MSELCLLCSRSLLGRSRRLLYVEHLLNLQDAALVYAVYLSYLGSNPLSVVCPFTVGFYEIWNWRCHFQKGSWLWSAHGSGVYNESLRMRESPSSASRFSCGIHSCLPIAPHGNMNRWIYISLCTFPDPIVNSCVYTRKTLQIRWALGLNA